MAIKDLHRGWGTLAPGMESWTCPMCALGSPVEDWKETRAVVRGNELDGRECPKCQYKSSTLADSDMMARVPKAVVEVKRVKKKNGKKA